MMPDDPSVKDGGEVAAALGVDVELGLTSQEASRRLAQDGLNELRSAPRASTWRRVLAQFQDPLVYLLLAAVAVTLAAWTWGIRYTNPAGICSTYISRSRGSCRCSTSRKAATRPSSPWSDAKE